eukprot:SAG31_NODE_1880_length_7001_cov_4.269052_2_plen_124_part_00
MPETAPARVPPVDTAVFIADTFSVSELGAAEQIAQQRRGVDGGLALRRVGLRGEAELLVAEGLRHGAPPRSAALASAAAGPHARTQPLSHFVRRGIPRGTDSSRLGPLLAPCMSRRWSSEFFL